MYRRVPLTMIPEGVVLASAVYDQEMRLLLGAGVPIVKDLIIGLHKRGVRTVIVTDSDWQRLTAFGSQGKTRNALPGHGPVKLDMANSASVELDAAAAVAAACDFVASENPFSANIQSHGIERYERDKMDQLVSAHQQTVDHVGNLLGQLQNHPIESESLRKLSRDSLIRAADDLDLFVCMGINPSSNNSIFAHSTNTAMLAVAIGTTLGLDENSLCDLGTGCLVHDAGMMQIDEKFYRTDQIIDQNDFVEIAKHPIIAADLLYKNMKQVPVGVRMIVYQMHERCDGSGYPRGTTGDKIHPLTKIASVADSYVALVSPRPHRAAMLPYFAMTKMLNDVKAGLFDATVVRALLHTVSLFPIGSYIELNDGRVGKTIRSNGPAYDRPTIESWKRTNLSALPDVIDLSEAGDLKVVKPLTALA